MNDEQRRFVLLQQDNPIPMGDPTSHFFVGGLQFSYSIHQLNIMASTVIQTEWRKFLRAVIHAKRQNRVKCHVLLSMWMNRMVQIEDSEKVSEAPTVNMMVRIGFHERSLFDSVVSFYNPEMAPTCQAITSENAAEMTANKESGITAFAVSMQSLTRGFLVRNRLLKNNPPSADQQSMFISLVG